ncbi:MAG TPA: helix-turn-helix transcriptional regulator [Candidatus Saccharimonadales bacterium]
MTDQANKETGKRIVKYRKTLGLSQEALHDKSGVPANTIARLERGEHTATTPTLRKLAKALDVTLSDLIGG